MAFESNATLNADHSRSITDSTRDPQLGEKLAVDVEASQAEDSEGTNLSGIRKALMLAIVCFAQFFDLFNANAAIVSLPSMGEDLNFAPSELQWVLSAYTLTFASFLLISGTLSDIFHPNPVFVLGLLLIGLFSIPVGASVHPIMAIIFRAIQGIGAALNVPSAVAIIRTTFHDPMQQSNAYAAYSLAGAIGGNIGFVIGGVLTAQSSWRWVHYLIAILTIPMAGCSWFVLPCVEKPKKLKQSRRIDFAGVTILTAGLILFVYAISDGSEAGWQTPQVITTLILSVVFIIVFFFVERFVSDPALPPSIWSNKNFTPIFIIAWSPYWWAFGCLMQLITIFTDLWGDSALIASIRCLPIGVAAMVFSFVAGKLVPKLPSRVSIVSAHICMIVGATLYALANEKGKYWSHVVPGMIIAFIGLPTLFLTCTTMAMGSARKGEEGVVGAVMFTAYQVGSTLGLAIVTSIRLGVSSSISHEGPAPLEGFAASFWSIVGLSGVTIIITLLFISD
ncbi:hypothetical protein ONZ45_g13945 [Pleurotus djamor]|nr:hypothetical protein ONZ45_g13945 [Pleurotus djamor]